MFINVEDKKVQTKMAKTIKSIGGNKFPALLFSN